MSKIKQTIVAAIISITVFVFVIVILSYVSNINGILMDFTVNELETNIKAHQEEFDTYLENERISLERMARTLSIFSSEQQQTQTAIYLKEAEEYSLNNMVFAIDINGKGINHNSEVVDISGEDYFQQTINGQSIVTSVRKSNDGVYDVIVMTVPIYFEDIVQGVLVAEYPVEDLKSLIEFDKGEEVSIVSSTFKTIFSVESDAQNLEEEPLVEAFENLIFEESDYQTIINDFATGTAGSAMVNDEGVSKNVEYRPLNVNGWMLIASVDSNILSEDVQYIIQMISILTIGMIFVFAALVGYVFVSRQNYIRDIEQVAYFDDLTGLANINKFKLDVKEMIKKNPTVEYAVVKVDIVNFKTINVMYDFNMGNNVIIAIATVLTEARFSDQYIVARAGIDEFLLFAKSFVLKDLDNSKYIYEAAFKRKVPSISEHNIEFRYGRYILEKGENNVESIIDKVNLAHASGKGGSLDKIYDYDETVENQMIKNTEIQNKMHTALEAEEFKAFLQPKFNIATNEVAGAEALVRWIEKDGTMVMPGDFISVFESNGFITKIDIYIFTEICKNIRKWMDLSYKVVPVSVNFSRLHFYNDNFIDELIYITDRYEVPRNLIEVEITESVMFDNEEVMLETTQKLREQGFKVSIDDFGSGYSSLGQLKNLFVDVVKIDRSFFLKANDEIKGNLVVASTVDMLHKLDLETVAEGVETKEQVEFLNEIGCELGQGYFYSKPIPVNDFEDNFLKSIHQKG